MTLGENILSSQFQVGNSVLYHCQLGMYMSVKTTKNVDNAISSKGQKSHTLIKFTVG